MKKTLLNILKFITGTVLLAILFYIICGIGWVLYNFLNIDCFITNEIPGLIDLFFTGIFILLFSIVAVGIIISIYMIGENIIETFKN